MAMNIKITSDAKGSNHGGRCIVRESGQEKKFYIKHCSGSKISRGNSSFVYQHQPIYEAVTCELASELGLRTPNFYVLLNKQHDVKFSSDNGQKVEVRENEPFYFISELMPIPNREDLQKANEIIKNSEFYLDLLSISDIVGKKHNYFIDHQIEDVVYVDLGCNFVDAHERSIEFKRHHKGPLKKKVKKKAMHQFEKYDIITRKGDRIGLVEFLESPREMKIKTMNPRKKVSLDSLITGDEVEEIVDRLIAGLYESNHLKRNGNESNLIRRSNN